MNLRTGYVLCLALCFSCGISYAQLEILPDRELPAVFAGNGRKIAVTFHNSGHETVTTTLSTQLYQATSVTAVAVGQPNDWKKLEVLPGQTVLDSVTLDFPSVKGETKFIVRWQEDAAHVLGKTEVRVYPTNLLAALKTLAGEGGPGVYDPQNEIKPLLKNLDVEFEDLENSSVEHFPGRLAIIGPFASREQMREGLAVEIKALAKKSAGVVWLQPPPEKKPRNVEKPVPSFYSVLENTNAVVVVQHDLVTGLAENPQAQLNLVFFCQMALNPRPPVLPVLSVPQ
jgi:hypothetical protein